MAAGSLPMGRPGGRQSRALESQNSSRHESSLRGDLSFLDPSVDHLIDLVEALAQFGVVQNLDRKDLREAGS